MPRIPFQKTQQDVQSLTAMLRERLKTGKSLVYYASGRIVKKAYYDLPYDHIVLVDYSFRSTFAVRGKVIIVGMTALQATAAFIKAGVKFDAFVCINEGLSEGGGYYPINGNWSMGTILPVLKDTYLHIACPGYYGRTRWREKLFNLPHQATLLDTYDKDYIDPAIFSAYSNYGDTAGIWRVTKQPGEAVTFRAGNRKITLQRKNIWDDYEMLDQLLVRCTPQEAKNLNQLGSKARPHWRTNYEYRKCDYESNFEQILHYCNLHNIKKLGLTPWLGGNYNRFIDYLKANEARCPYPQELYFYHLHHNDYQQLYQQAGVTTQAPKTIVEIPSSSLMVQKADECKKGFINTNKTKILYIHGYNSCLTEPKRKVLEVYGEVVAPLINYNSPSYFKKLLPLAEKADVIIGSSFGGHTGHLLSMAFDKPALLFNPAFVTKFPTPDLQDLNIPETKTSHTTIVLGKLDDVIIYRDNLEYVSGSLSLDDVRIVEVDELEHRIPEDVFEEQVKQFWKML